MILESCVVGYASADKDFGGTSFWGSLLDSLQRNSKNLGREKAPTESAEEGASAARREDVSGDSSPFTQTSTHKRSVHGSVFDSEENDSLSEAPV